MLAVEMCLACLRDAATPTNELSAYARENEQILRVEAADLSLHEMLRTRLQVPYPQGLWGRAYVTGLRLKSKVGWLRVKLLADHFGCDGTPDVRAWLKSLSPPKRRQAAYRILGTPDESWV